MVWWLWQETGRCDSWELTFAEMLVCSKADLRQVENEEPAIKNDVLGLSFLLCNRTQSTTSRLVLDEVVNILFFTEAQQNFNKTCIEAGVPSIFHIL